MLAAALLSIAFAPRAASAQPAALQGVPLVVQRAPAAADCSDATALAARVEALIGRQALIPATEAGAGFAFEVQILKAEDGYTAIVLAIGKSRQISDPGPTCASLSEALAAMLAILVDADEQPAPPPIVPPPSPPPTATTPAQVAEPPPPPLPSPVDLGGRLLLSPSFGVSSGLTGDATPAVVLVNDLRVWGPFSLLAGFTWTPPQDFALAPGRVEIQLMYGQAAPCVSTWALFGRSRLGGCLQVNVGAIRGKGIGYFRNGEVTRPWVSMGLTALLDVHVVGPVYWSLRASAFATVTEEAFQVDGIGVAFDPSPVGFLGSTGVGVRIF